MISRYYQGLAAAIFLLAFACTDVWAQGCGRVYYFTKEIITKKYVDHYLNGNPVYGYEFGPPETYTTGGKTTCANNCPCECDFKSETTITVFQDRVGGSVITRTGIDTCTCKAPNRRRSLLGQCCAPGDLCCNDPDPCCGNTDPCCGSSDPCCGSSVCDDPIFTGFDGSKYQVLAYNAYFALLSEPMHQVNALLEPGHERNYEILWMTQIGMKYGSGFSAAVSIPTDKAFHAGTPSVYATINGVNATQLFTGHEEKYGNVHVSFPVSDLIWNTTSTPLGVGRSATLVVVTTPQFQFKVMLGIPAAPVGDELRTPHLDIGIHILAPLQPNLVGGLLGESVSWNGNAPFERGLLSAKDNAYEVSGLLEHDFKLNTFRGNDKGRKLLVIPKGDVAAVVGHSAGSMGFGRTYSRSNVWDAVLRPLGTALHP